MRVLSAPSQSRAVWQEVPAHWFHWDTVISVPWRDQHSHITICEARARGLQVRWRARHAEQLGTRYLDLMDSQANLSAASKGRTASDRLRHVNLRTNAVLLAGHLREVNGYTRSDRNPADHGSRDVHAWDAHRRQHACGPAPARDTPRQEGAACDAPARARL